MCYQHSHTKPKHTMLYQLLWKKLPQLKWGQVLFNNNSETEKYTLCSIANGSFELRCSEHVDSATESLNVKHQILLKFLLNLRQSDHCNLHILAGFFFLGTFRHYLSHWVTYLTKCTVSGSVKSRQNSQFTWTDDMTKDPRLQFFAAKMDMPNESVQLLRGESLSNRVCPKYWQGFSVVSQTGFGKLFCGSFDLQTAKARSLPQWIIYEKINLKVIKNYLSHKAVSAHAAGNKEKLSAILALIQYINVCLFTVVSYSILDQSRLTDFVFCCDGMP